MPAGLLAALPIILAALQALAPLIEQGVADLEKNHPAIGPLADGQSNLKAAIEAFTAALATK